MEEVGESMRREQIQTSFNAVLPWVLSKTEVTIEGTYGKEIDDADYVTARLFSFGTIFNFSLFKSLLLGLSETPDKSLFKSCVK